MCTKQRCQKLTFLTALFIGLIIYISLFLVPGAAPKQLVLGMLWWMMGFHPIVLFSDKTFSKMWHLVNLWKGLSYETSRPEKESSDSEAQYNREFSYSSPFESRESCGSAWEALHASCSLQEERRRTHSDDSEGHIYLWGPAQLDLALAFSIVV